MKHRRTQSAGFDGVEQMMHSGQKIKHISVLSRLNGRQLRAVQIIKNWPQIQIEKQISLRSPSGIDSKRDVCRKAAWNGIYKLLAINDVCQYRLRDLPDCSLYSHLTVSEGDQSFTSLMSPNQPTAAKYEHKYVEV